MKLNNRFIFGILSLVLAAVIAFVALPTIARQTNGKTEIVRITQPVLKGEQVTKENAEVVEVGGYNLPTNVAHSLEDVEGLYVTADLAAGDYILTSKVSSVPISSDVALNDIPSGKVAISLTVKTLASGLSDKLQPNDIVRIYHFLETAEEVPELRFVKVLSVTDSDGINVDNKAVGHIQAALAFPLPLDMLHIVYGALDALCQIKIPHLITLLIRQGEFRLFLPRQSFIDVEALRCIAVTVDVVLKRCFSHKASLQQLAGRPQRTPGHCTCIMQPQGAPAAARFLCFPSSQPKAHLPANGRQGARYG